METKKKKDIWDDSREKKEFLSKLVIKTNGCSALLHTNPHAAVKDVDLFWSGQDRPGQVKSGQARPGQVSPVQSRLGQARPGQSRSGQVRSYLISSNIAKLVVGWQWINQDRWSILSCLRSCGVVFCIWITLRPWKNLLYWSKEFCGYWWAVSFKMFRYWLKLLKYF